MGTVIDNTFSEDYIDLEAFVENKTNNSPAPSPGKEGPRQNSQAGLANFPLSPTDADIDVVRGWTNTIVFTATSATVVSWAAGALTMPNGDVYNIDAGNTGTMAAITYIYLDINVSLTVLQITTTGGDAVGTGKLLVAVAQQQTAPKLSIFQAFGTKAQNNFITADNIAANSITANELLVNTLSALTANMGSLTAGQIVIGSTNKLWLNDSADGALNIGGATKATAPFRVSADGSVVALKITASNIATYEATVDAAGNGDYTTIGAALTAGKKTIFVKKGTYSITADIAYSTSDITIIGENIDGVIIAGDSAARYIIFSGDSFKIQNCTIQFQLQISGDYSSIWNCKFNTGTYAGQLYANTTSEFGTVSQCIFENSKKAVINDNRSFTNNIFTAGANTISEMVQCRDYCNIQSNYFIKTTQNIDGAYVFGDNNTVSGNYFFSANSTNQTAIGVYGEYNSIIGNNVTKYAVGVNIDYSPLDSGYRGTLVEGNYIYQSGTGIAAHTDVQNLTGITSIIGNNLIDCVLYGIYSDGMDAVGNGAGQILASGNTITGGCSNSGMIFLLNAGQVQHLQILNNRIQDTTGNGLEIVETIDTFICIDCTIANNYVRSCDGIGFYINGTGTAGILRLVAIGNSSRSNGTNLSIHATRTACEIGYNIPAW